MNSNDRRLFLVACGLCALAFLTWIGMHALETAYDMQRLALPPYQEVTDD